MNYGSSTVFVSCTVFSSLTSKTWRNDNLQSKYFLPNSGHSFAERLLTFSNTMNGLFVSVTLETHAFESHLIYCDDFLICYAILWPNTCISFSTSSYSSDRRLFVKLIALYLKLTLVQVVTILLHTPILFRKQRGPKL